MEKSQESAPRLGPDQILPASSYTTSAINGATIIRMEKTGPSSEKPISVYSFLKETADKYPNQKALSQKIDGKWVSWTYKEYFYESCRVARSMIKLGLERFHGVCIMGFNSPEWMFTNMGCIFAGGLSAGVYTTNSPEACRHLVDNCQAQIIVVDNQRSLDKFLSVKDSLPSIKVFVQWIGKPTTPGVLSWQELIKIGENETDDVLKERLSLQAVNQCCNLIYTSGTTGPPKGVMCSQDHMTWSAKQFKANMKLKMCESVNISYLPLCHSAGQLSDIYVPISSAVHVYFAEPDALKGSLLPSLLEIQPTAFFAVPRVWEKFYEKIQEVSAKSGLFSSLLSQWARYHGLNQVNAIKDGRELSIFETMKGSLASSLVLKRIQEAIGLGRAEICYTGAAPLNADVEEFFMSIGIPVMQVYGLSESISLGSHGYCQKGEFKPATAGKISSQIEAKTIADNELKEGEGEICIRGRSICMGYLKMPDKTEEAIDDEGWLHTGDLGYIDEDQFLFITGRLKELVITAGGENIPPVLIEDFVKKELPCISNCILVGDRRKYLSMLLTLKAEVEPETGMPLQNLTEDCVAWFQEQGFNATVIDDVIQEVAQNPQGKTARAIHAGIVRYNTNGAISNAQKIQRWKILPNDFSLPTGEINNFLKVKRSFVLSKYSSLIDDMYKESFLIT